MKGEGDMSVHSNPVPEDSDAGPSGERPRELPPCDCPPEGHTVGQMCPHCQSDYDRWASEVAGQLPLPGEEDSEPCGQQFPDEMPH
jgi:hypothetical protein